VNAEAIKADYQNGVLTLSIPKREEAKPKQIKVNIGTPAMAAAAGKRTSTKYVVREKGRASVPAPFYSNRIEERLLCCDLKK
jgi:Hsp20/alpha crystallin family